MLNSPLIITGMHRSGTSLLANYVTRLGIDLGQELSPADATNPKGYIEDIHFLDLQRTMLRAASAKDDGGHPDWGWTESEQLDQAVFADYRQAALVLLQKRSDSPKPWGWKDPRTTLLLPFWQELVPEACYLLLYRFPWDVADSMQRLGADVFLNNPEYAYRIWAYYNQELLQFYKCHSSRAILASSNAILQQPEQFIQLLRHKFDLQLPDNILDQLYEKSWFHTLAGNDSLIGLVNAVSGGSITLLKELDEYADISAKTLWSLPKSPSSRLATRAAGVTVDLSVVIPCLDHGQYLLEAIASVERSLRAGYSCELIIVNDGSQQEHTLRILRVLGERGYHIINQAHKGLSAARNLGFESARGRYLLPLDADNRLCPDFIGNALQVLESNPEIGIVYGDRYEFGKRTQRCRVPEFDLQKMLIRNSIDACAVLRRNVWLDVGGYDTNLPALEDWEFWIHVGKKQWRFHHLNEITFEYRVRPNSLVTIAQDYDTIAQILILMFTKHQPLHWDCMQQHIGRTTELLFWLLDYYKKTSAESKQLKNNLAESHQTIRELEKLLAEREELSAGRYKPNT